MDEFRPSRSSSPPRRRQVAQSTRTSAPSAEKSRLIEASSSEFSDLLPEEIRVLDAIIRHAGPGASGFPTIFRAYEVVLPLHGIDRGELFYYGKLLKLGTLFSGTWAEKWEAVKTQHGYLAAPDDNPRLKKGYEPPIPSIPPLSNAQRPHSYPRSSSPDSLTLHSGKSNTTVEKQRIDLPRQSKHSFQPNPDEDPTGLRYRRQTTAIKQYIPIIDATSKTQDPHGRQFLATPSSVAASQPPREASTSGIARQNDNMRWRTLTAHTRTPLPALVSRTQADGEDKRQQMRMATSLKLLEQRLLGKCWEVWKQGVRWIFTTSEQIDAARNSILLRIYLHRWRRKLLATRSRLSVPFNAVVALGQRRRLSEAFTVWTQKALAQRWKHEMRDKMKILATQLNGNLRREYWARWRLAYKASLVQQRSSNLITARFFHRWKRRMIILEQFSESADVFAQGRDDGLLMKMWWTWRSRTQLQETFNLLRSSVDSHIMKRSLDIWKQRAINNCIADDLYNKSLRKRALFMWRSSLSRIRRLERHALKYHTSQNQVIMRAAMRIWVARERGHLYRRVQRFKLLEYAWGLWRDRTLHIYTLQATGQQFLHRPNSLLKIAAFQRWQRVSLRRTQHISLAVQHATMMLKVKTMRRWHLILVSKLQQKNSALLLSNKFLMRRAWKRYRLIFVAKRLQQSARLIELNFMRKVLRYWLSKMYRHRQMHIAEVFCQKQATKRTLKWALSHWMIRVVDIKDAEWQVTREYDKGLLLRAFHAWKLASGRRRENLRLSESFSDVRREELLSRTFYHWLSAARSAKRRRLALQEKEEDVKLAILSEAWDRWRYRYKEQTLRPLEINFMIENQRATLARYLSRWYLQTKSLPAIRYDTLRLKRYYWQAWRNAMPPAPQSKLARARNRTRILRRYLDEWVQRYRMKVALKAVARARYFNIPDAPLQATKRQNTAVRTSASLHSTSRRAAVKVQDDNRGAVYSPPTRGQTVANGLQNRVARSETNSRSNSKARESSPARSTKSSLRNWYERERTIQRRPSDADDGRGRNRLVQELYEMRKKAKGS